MKLRSEGVGFLVPIVAFVVVFSLLPVALLFANALGQVGGWGGFVSVISAAPNRRALDNSLEQGSISAALAVAVGYPAGVFVGRYSFRGRSLLRSLLLVPFLLHYMSDTPATPEELGRAAVKAARGKRRR